MFRQLRMVDFTKKAATGRLAVMRPQWVGLQEHERSLRAPIGVAVIQVGARRHCRHYLKCPLAGGEGLGDEGQSPDR